MGLFDFFTGTDDSSQAASEEVAAQQRAIAEQQRQLAETKANFDPFIQAGIGQIPALTQGASAGGLDARLAEIFGTDTFGALKDERTRALEGQLSAGGLTRSGTAIQEASAIPTDIGLALEQLLTGRSSNIAASGQNAAAGLGGISANTSGNIAQLLAQQGVSRGSGILGDAQSKAAGTQNIIDAASTAAIFFSDPSLKENIEKVGQIHDLNLYEWDWIEDTKGTMIEQCGTIGFMADEVEELYPHHVAEFGGFMVVDYPALLDEMETK
tara:strand:- start:3452 stop:4258 length:807 start_codon:yes stop_codon:yes gene_type:complete